MALPPPPADFCELPLHIKKLAASSLKRIGRRSAGEPYFGRHAVNRFDDPGKRFGTCYCGLQLDTAIAESVLHDELPEKGQFRIRREEIETRFLVSFAAVPDCAMLRLADLTGTRLKRLGGNNSLSADYPYDVSQQWAAAVHAHPAQVDGLLFVSRQLNDKRAVVLFDRAHAKLGAPSYTPLAQARGLAQARRRLGIVIVE